MPNTAKLPGGVVVERATPGALPLSLDDAIARGEKHNLQQLLVIQNERMVRGQVLTVKNNLLPSLTAKGYLEAQQIRPGGARIQTRVACGTWVSRPGRFRRL